MNVDTNQIYLASTGVIGEPLEHSKIISKIPYLINKLNNKSESWIKAANAIRTTDTYAKYHSEKVQIKKKKINFYKWTSKRIWNDCTKHGYNALIYCYKCKFII